MHRPVSVVASDRQFDRTDNPKVELFKQQVPYRVTQTTMPSSQKPPHVSPNGSFWFIPVLWPVTTSTCHTVLYSPSIVGSYSSTKWLWTNWRVIALFPTPPPPTTTTLYSRCEMFILSLVSSLKFHSRWLFACICVIEVEPIRLRYWVYQAESAQTTLCFFG